ncbi:MAG: ABC transporter permease [Actinomycetaceae bacterium]|nr:ABC transporter permease [Actinomycetaceae bacterium]
MNEKPVSPETQAATKKKGRGRFSSFMRSFLKHKLALVGVAILIFWIFDALVLTQLYGIDPLAQSFTPHTPPSPQHPFGTDEVGRDVLARTIHGVKTSLPLALMLVVCAAIIGTTLGAVAGYFGKIVGETIMRLADLVLAFPTIILAMIVAAALGPGLMNAVLAMLVVTWPQYARVSRSMVLSASRSEYVLSARLLGASSGKVLLRDILPNIVSGVLVLATMDVGSAVLLLSGLSFLGLGALPPTPDWGLSVSTGVQFFSSWWIAVFAGLAIFTVVMAFNFIGDALRDILDPQTSGTSEEGH